MSVQSSAERLSSFAKYSIAKQRWIQHLRNIRNSDFLHFDHEYHAKPERYSWVRRGIIEPKYRNLSSQRKNAIILEVAKAGKINEQWYYLVYTCMLHAHLCHNRNQFRLNHKITQMKNYIVQASNNYTLTEMTIYCIWNTTHAQKQNIRNGEINASKALDNTASLQFNFAFLLLHFLLSRSFLSKEAWQRY